LDLLLIKIAENETDVTCRGVSDYIYQYKKVKYLIVIVITVCYNKSNKFRKE